jgi:predicted nucleotidyltransferase
MRSAYESNQANSPFIKSPFLEVAIDAVSEWAIEVEKTGLISDAFLFGSTVNDEGSRFDSSKSDLDIIVVVPWAQLPIEVRIGQMKTLSDYKVQLEYKLQLALQRNLAGEQIVSLVPMTDWELMQSIHKDGNAEILTSTRAINLISNAAVSVIANTISAGRVSEAQKRTISFVQKQRAQFIGRPANGKHLFAIKPHEDPIPKELMRHFAIATSDEQMSAEEVTDLARGLQEIELALEDRADSLPLVRSYRNWLQVRRGARGTVTPIIDADYYLITCELMYDIIVNQFPPISSVAISQGVTAAGTGSLPSIEKTVDFSKLDAVFYVTTRNRLASTVSENMLACGSARANMMAGIKPPFEVRFSESGRAAKLLETPDYELSPESRQAKIKAFERRVIVKALHQRIYDGMHLILLYGGALFRDLGNLCTGMQFS